MFQDEKTELKKENETYDSIIQKEIISNENTNKDIKLTSDENIEENNCFEKILNNSITNKIIEYENLLSKKVYDYLQTYHIESSYRNFVIFLIIGLIFIFKSVIDLPTFNLTPIQFLIFFNIGNIFIFFALFFYYGSQQYLIFLIEKTRKRILFFYIITLIIGIIIAWRDHYFLSLVMAYNQIFIFSLFVISIIPGENNGIDFIKNNIENPIKNFFNSIKNYFFIKKNNNNKNELTQ
jgi:hypothetical protein